jgi:hypothetical protein
MPVDAEVASLPDPTEIASSGATSSSVCNDKEYSLKSKEATSFGAVTSALTALRS